MWILWIKNNYRLLIGCGLLGASFLAGWHIEGNRKQIEIDALTSAINAADAVAQEKIKTQKENLNALKQKSDSDDARIANYYRMLHAKNPTSTSATSNQTNDGTSSQQNSSGHDIEFESRCVKDAESVSLWLEYAIRNHIPVEP
jgi:predicted negative regulator of RcsB-dependent stress response